MTGIDFDNQNLEISGQPLTPYDKAIIDAVYNIYIETLLKRKKLTFTLPQLRDEITYISGNLNNETLEQLRKSLKKLMLRRVKIDVTDRMTRMDVEKTIFESYLLPLSSYVITMNNGMTLEGFEFFEIPAIYGCNNKQVKE